MKDHSSFGIGLIGCGDIGRLRAEALRKGGLRLNAVADVDAERAKAVAGAAAVLTDWQGLLARSDVDAVIVSTPPKLHVEMCVAAARAGKHVLCEKPLALTAEEGRTIAGAAAEAGVRVATGFNYRFYPSFVQARAWLDEGLIGRVDHIRSYGGYSAAGHNQPWVHDAAVTGGGALRDIGIHLLDLTCDFLGPVSEVVGMSSSNGWGYPGCEDNGFALLKGPNGAVASVHASWTEWRRYEFSIEIYGSLGSIRATCFPMYADVQWASTISGPSQRRVERYLTTQVIEKVHSYRRIVVDSFVLEHQAFLDYINARASRIATVDDGIRSLEIVERALGTGPDPRV